MLLGAARADAACAASGGKLFIAGGRAADGSLLNELLSFDPSSGEVKALTPLSYGRCGAGAGGVWAEGGAHDWPGGSSGEWQWECPFADPGRRHEQGSVQRWGATIRVWDRQPKFICSQRSSPFAASQLSLLQAPGEAWQPGCLASMAPAQCAASSLCSRVPPSPTSLISLASTASCACLCSGDLELVSLPGGSLLSIGGIGNTSNPGIQASCAAAGLSLAQVGR